MIEMHCSTDVLFFKKHLLSCLWMSQKQTIPQGAQTFPMNLDDLIQLNSQDAKCQNDISVDVDRRDLLTFTFSRFGSRCFLSDGPVSAP